MSSQTNQAYTDNYDTLKGLITKSDLSAYQFSVVKFASTAGQVKLAATSLLALGGFILMNDPKGTSTAGAVCECAYQGIVKAIAGTSVMTVGANLRCNTTSQLVPTTTASVPIIARCLQAPTTKGDLIPVALFQGGRLY
jgi:hypothetical protein